jgi:site-specific DNA-cytosine methylase
MSVPASGHGVYRAFLMNTSADKWGDGLRGAAGAAATIRTGAQHLPRAFIVDQLNSGRDSTIRQAGEPIWTIPIYSGKHPPPRAWLAQGRVVKLTPRALARFQSVPDSYQLPDSNTLACRIIGNGVACLVAQRVTASLLDTEELTQAA